MVLRLVYSAKAARYLRRVRSNAPKPAVSISARISSRMSPQPGMESHAQSDRLALDRVGRVETRARARSICWRRASDLPKTSATSATPGRDSVRWRRMANSASTADVWGLVLMDTNFSSRLLLGGRRYIGAPQRFNGIRNSVPICTSGDGPIPEKPQARCGIAHGLGLNGGIRPLKTMIRD